MTISLNTLISQLITSSTIPISRTEVRYVVTVVSSCVPWFCRIIEIGGACGSNLIGNVGGETEMGRVMGGDTVDGMGGDGGDGMGGKENDFKGMSAMNGMGRGRGVEGLLIFGKRDGRLIGREEVLAQFRMKKEEYERQMKG